MFADHKNLFTLQYMNEKNTPSFFFGFDLRRIPPSANGGDPYIGAVDDWPQHITLFPPTKELEGTTPEPLFDAVADIASRSTPLIVMPQYEAYFQGDTQVTVFDNLRHIHYALLGAVHAYGYGSQFPDTYTGRNYNAHTSHMEGLITPTEAIALTGLSVFRKNEQGSKYVFARYKLGTRNVRYIN